jgi:hypothetical protein
LISLQSTCPLLCVGMSNKSFSLQVIIDIFFVSDGWHTRSKQVDRLLARNVRVNEFCRSLKWINIQATLLDICIAFYPLQLPPYVLLEIVDRFRFWSTHVQRKKKIDYIIRIKRFCDDLIESRQTTKLNVDNWMINNRNRQTISNAYAWTWSRRLPRQLPIPMVNCYTVKFVSSTQNNHTLKLKIEWSNYQQLTIIK